MELVKCAEQADPFRPSTNSMPRARRRKDRWLEDAFRLPILRQSDAPECLHVDVPGADDLGFHLVRLQIFVNAGESLKANELKVLSQHARPAGSVLVIASQEFVQRLPGQQTKGRRRWETTGGLSKLPLSSASPTCIDNVDECQ